MTDGASESSTEMVAWQLRSRGALATTSRKRRSASPTPGPAEHQRAADDGIQGMEAELQSRRHPEVAARATKPPQQLRMLVAVGVDDPSVGDHQLGSEQVVAGQAVLGGQVADPAAQGQPADAGGTNHAAGGHQAVRLRRLIEVDPGRSALGAGDPSGAVDLDAAQPRQVDHQPAVHDAVPGGIVPAAAHRDLQVVHAGEPEGGRDVPWPGALRDHRRPAVDHGVEADPRGVVPGIGRRQHPPSQRPAQLAQGPRDGQGSPIINVLHGTLLAVDVPPQSMHLRPLMALSVSNGKQPQATSRYPSISQPGWSRLHNVVW
jgi:hypothetical protein